jgi:hypothetical protein
MATGGRTQDESQGGDDNVIHFPREWFGSTDDLVPFGPAAERLDRAAADAEEPPAAAELQAVEPIAPELEALSADAFWGEESGSLHRVFELPADHPPDPFDSELGRSPSVSVVTRPTRRWWWIAAAVAVALIAMAVTGEVFASAQSTSRSRSALDVGATSTSNHATSSTAETTADASHVSDAAQKAALATHAATERHPDRVTARSHSTKTSRRSRTHVNRGRAQGSRAARTVAKEPLTTTSTQAETEVPGSSQTDVVASSGQVATADDTSAETPTESLAHTTGSSDQESSTKQPASGPSGLGGAVGKQCNPLCK